jgi:SsrA-binding protein
MSDSNQLVSNRRARHDYEILETFEAGLVLQGTEVKSLRAHLGSLQEAYIKELDGEMTLIGCFIPHYKFGNIYNHEETRERKLLLHKREILRLGAQVREKGLTLIPLDIHITKKGKIKLSFAIARGKKLHDKRKSLKEEEDRRDMSRAMRQDM